MTFTVTTEFLHILLVMYGVPDSKVSDNSTQFMVNEFKTVCKKYSIERVTTLLYHTKSNRQAEI